MQLSELTNAISVLGNDLLHIPDEIIIKANQQNPWFTPEFIHLAAKNWKQALETDQVENWLKNREFSLKDKSVGIIMAGNIPFVGLHDLLSALVSGLKVKLKLSSTDEVLMKYAIASLTKSIPALKERIDIEGQLKGISYLIATGSNNSARYFEYYFKGIPSLIRKNRTSLAVLSGNENEETLTLLADDIYTYFGLGCRNVSHLLLPRSINYKSLYEAYDKYMDHVNHHKFYNNYMYHKSILLMNLDKHYDNGFMLFQEKSALHAPIATLNYHFYDDLSEVQKYLTENAEQLQCVVSEIPEIKDSISFGSTQKPSLFDYADKVNTLDFLNS